MKVYPIFLGVEGRRCVVIGGGEVAERKTDTLRRAGAVVTIVSPALTAGLADRAARGDVEHVPRPYRAGDLRGAFLAYAATDDETVHAEIAAEAERERVLLNVVDRPRWCTFIVPSILERGDLTVAVSTGGACPAMARRVRQDVERALGAGHEQALVVLARLREVLRERGLSDVDRRRILTSLAQSRLVELLAARDGAAVDRLLSQEAGADVSLAALGVGGVTEGDDAAPASAI